MGLGNPLRGANEWIKGVVIAVVTDAPIVAVFATARRPMTSPFWAPRVRHVRCVFSRLDFRLKMKES